MAADPLIRLRGVRFGYDGGRPVLDGVDLDVFPGDRIGLVGPNGSGKSTLAHVIMGLVRPTAGTVEIAGRERRTEADFREVRPRIGFLFQDADDQLFCPTVIEDVAFGPLNLGRSHAGAWQLAKETLARLGIPHLADRVTYKLSGGEKRLAALATVLALEPLALILDEPTAGLDPDTEERIVGLLDTIDLPFLIISHDRPFLARTSRRTLMLQAGRLREAPGRDPGHGIEVSPTS